MGLGEKPELSSLTTAFPTRYLNNSLSFVRAHEEFVLPALVFLVLRLFTAVAVVILIQRTPAEYPDWMNQNPSGQTYHLILPSPDAPFYTQLESWARYDTTWYAKIAYQGYLPNDPSVAFEPGYPLIIRITATLLSINYVLAALLVSNIAGLAFFILLYKLIRKEFNDTALARRTLVLLAAFPTAYYFVAGYTESVFMALVTGALLAALNRRWWAAGILAALASFTRWQGVLLCLPLAWIAYIQLRESSIKAIFARAPAVLGALVSPPLYLLYLNLNHFYTLDTAKVVAWQTTTRMPWESVITFFHRLSRHYPGSREMSNAGILLIFAVLAVFVLFKLRPTYSLYAWSTIIVLLMRYHDGTQFESVFRYVVALFPCFIMAAFILRKWWLVLPVAAFTLYWQLILLDRFVHWIWVA
jgi:Gpi18-like mannosyltransferase